MLASPTPGQPLERTRHFRNRAEELRTIANEWIDSGTREMLGRVAKDYDHMAELWEKHRELKEALEDA